MTRFLPGARSPAVRDATTTWKIERVVFDLQGGTVVIDKVLLVERGTGPTDPTKHYRLAEAVPGPGKEL